MTIILAFDLAFRNTGYVALGLGDMAVLVHGVIRNPNQGTLEAQCAKLRTGMLKILVDLRNRYPEDDVEVIAYETPGAVLKRRNRHIDTPVSWGRAQGCLMLAVDTWRGYLKQHGIDPDFLLVGEWDQADVKEWIVGDRRAPKDIVAQVLAFRQGDEFFLPEGQDLEQWTDHEMDALAVALCEAQQQRMERMSE